MTPEELAAIRADLNVFGECSVKRARALCDALTAAWAERDDLRDERDASNDSNLGHCDLIEKLQVDAGLCDCENLRVRAERAEADRESLQRQNDELDATLARIRDAVRPGRQFASAQHCKNVIAALVEGRT